VGDDLRSFGPGLEAMDLNGIGRMSVITCQEPPGRLQGGLLCGKV
jgi:hypothetical protein